MHSWKDRVTDKLTNLFSDSPSSPVSSPHKARSHTKDGGYFSSVLTFMRSPNESGSDKHDNHLKPIQSLPTRWKSKEYSWQQIPVDTYDEVDDEFDPREQNGNQSSSKSMKCDNREVSNTREENGDQYSVESTGSSEVFEDAAEPNTPMRAGSTLKHGISLRTLIRKSADLSGPCLLITGDTRGAVFGGLLNCPLTPTPKRKYQGTYETFVFTTLYGAPRLFRPTGANRYFYMCLNDMLALGGGGNFALCLNEDLLTGTSGRCDTFGNQCLAHDESFTIKNVELWSFAHSSRYP